MPQGRRKVPFSGKAKKEQLKAKRQMKGGISKEGNKNVLLMAHSESYTSGDEMSSDFKVNLQPTASGKGMRLGSKTDPNRYVLQFHRETNAELKVLKEAAYKALQPVPPEKLELNAEEFYPEGLNFPKRPPWNSSMTREQLNAREHSYFLKYIKEIESKYNWKDLGYFELNLETWRQLWRVVEMSDILLFIIDIRFAAAMFPPSLYEFVTKELNKEMILIINKIDLAPSHLVVAWMQYFKLNYPDLKIICFTTLPGYNLRGDTEATPENKSLKLQTRRRRGKQRMAAEGAQKLLETCKEIVGGQVDLSTWEAKIAEEMNVEYEEMEVGTNIEAEVDTSYAEHVKYKNGVLTIGCVGQPNVGKSSIMNALMGRKVVSISRTPGHTKYFQTIFLTNTVRLCDCPGLVFPSKVPKNLQVLMGTFPIAQLRFPYSAMQYIAERLDLVSLLKLKHPNSDEQWSTMDVCEAWAIKRGYLTAKAARPDTYRAANSLLRMQLDGKICLCLYPPGFFNEIEKWTTHPDNELVKWIQARKHLQPEDPTDSTSKKSFSSSDDDESSADGDNELSDTSSGKESVKMEIAPETNKFSVLSTDD